MDIWLPPKPAIIIPAPKELQPPALGLTLMASTWAMRIRRQEASAPLIGALLDAAQASAASITDPFTVGSGAGLSVAVTSGDLIIAVIAQQVGLTTTAVTDNLGNTYTAQNTGTDAGIITGRMFYSIVSNAGTLNAVNFDTTSSSNDVHAAVAVYDGPFGAIDQNPANISGNTTNPIPCPASGTLSDPFDLVVSWIAAQHDDACPSSMGGGGTLAISTGGTGGARVAIGAQVPAATTSITHTFTFPNTNPGATVTGTASFTPA